MLSLIFASILWSFSFGIIKNLLSGLSPDIISLVRFSIAACLFLPWTSFRLLAKKEMLYLFFIGMIQFGLMYLFYIRAYAYLNAYQIAIFTTVTPFYVIVINAIYRRFFQIKFFLWVVLAILGACCAIYRPDQKLWVSLQGFILVQLADFCFATGQVMYKEWKVFKNQVHDSQVHFFLFLGGIAVAFIAMVMGNQFHQITQITYHQMIAILYLGAASCGLAFFLWNRGASTVSTPTLAIMNNVKIPLAVLIAWFFWGEQVMHINLWIGFIFIGMAVYFSLSSKNEIFISKKLKNN